MTPHLLDILLALAVLCIGLALLIGHALASRVLALIGTIVAGVVLLFHILS